QGIIISASPILSGTAGVLYGYALRFVTVSQLLSLAGILLGAGILVVGFAPSAALVLIGCAVIGFGGGLFEPACISKIFTHTPLRVHAVAMGLNVCAISLGQFAHPILVEVLRNRMGLTGAFVVLASALITVGLIFASRGEEKRRDGVVGELGR